MLGGGAVLLLGLAMIALPGPACVVIPAGLAILAIEFAWARRWLQSVRAILPKRRTDGAAVSRVTVKSMRRSLEFLLRRFWSTFSVKRRSA